MIARLRRLDRRWWWVGAAAVVGLVLRVAWVVWVAREPQELFDPVRYLGYARNIADGKGMTDQFWGYPTAYYPPGYPWFLGVVVWMSRPFTDDAPLVAGLVQAVLGAGTAVLGAIVARRLAGMRAAIVAAWGLALYPNLIFHTGALLGETLYNALFLGFCVVLLGVRTGTPVTWHRAAASGLLLGLAVMVRPISLAVVPVVIAYWWWSTHDRRLVLRTSAALLAMVLACIVPWTIRNAIRMDAFIPISTNTGDNLCMGHAPGANGSFSARETCNTDVSLRDGPAGEVAADEEKLDIALRGIRADPGREPWLLWRRAYFTWVRDGDHDGLIAVQSYRRDRWIALPTEARLLRIADLAYWLVAATGLVGMVQLVRRRRPEGWYVAGAAVMTALVPLAFFGDSRFKVPVIPLLIVMGAALVGRPPTEHPSGDQPVR